MGNLTVSYYIRKFRKTQFEKVNDYFDDIPFIPVKADAINGTESAFCAAHRCWEYAEVHEDSVNLACGAVMRGIPLEIAPIPVNSADKITRLKERLTDLENDALFSRKVPIHVYLEYMITKNNMENCIIENNNFYDADRNSKDLVAFRLVTNEECLTLTLDYYTLDRKIIDSPAFNASGKIPLKMHSIFCAIDKTFVMFDDEPFNLTFPEKAREQLHQLLNAYAGRKISFNTCLKGRDLINGIYLYPYEPNLFAVPGFKNGGTLTETERRSSDVFNIACRNLGIKSYKTLRKAFYQNPSVLCIYSALIRLGFKDANIINDILFDSDAFLFLEHDFTNIQRFVQFLREKKSEKSAWNVLKKNDWKTTEYKDSLEMFCLYRQYLTEEMCVALRTDGFSEYNHNTLAKLAIDIENKTIDFVYNPKQKELEDEVDGYHFCLPGSSDMLRTLGSKLHNCVASYKKKVLKSECLIVFAHKDGEYRLCIEVRGDIVWQQRADHNENPKGEDLAALTKWEAKHKLIFTQNSY